MSRVKLCHLISQQLLATHHCTGQISHIRLVWQIVRVC